MTLTSLADLSPGGVATITAVAAMDTDIRLRRRLLEMGLIPGTLVRLIRRAPLGDPLVLRLRGYDLSMRAAEARLVQVQAGVAS